MASSWTPSYSLPRWLCSRIDIPEPWKSRNSSRARSRAGSGRPAGPALKLMTRMAGLLADGPGGDTAQSPLLGGTPHSADPLDRGMGVGLGRRGHRGLSGWERRSLPDPGGEQGVGHRQHHRPGEEPRDPEPQEPPDDAGEDQEEGKVRPPGDEPGTEDVVHGHHGDPPDQQEGHLPRRPRGAEPDH